MPRRFNLEEREGEGGSLMITNGGEDLIPGLPAELASLCLAKLPLDAIARSRAVSRAWASTLCAYPPSGRSPHGLAVYCRGKEDAHSRSWLFLSRSDLRSLVIPFSFKPAQTDAPCMYASSLDVIATGTPLLLVHADVQFGHDPEACRHPCISAGSDCEEDGHLHGSLQGFDVWQMKWLNSTETPWSRMPVDRWQFATAHTDTHAYFAGGVGPAAASSAERLSLDTWTWETLPPMHKERRFHPSGFAIAGRFFIVGGESHMELGNLPQSGEFYDPNTDAWMLVPEMWPHELWWAFGGAQKVIAVNDVAYAIDHKLQVVFQLTMDNASLVNMKWQMVGHLPWSEFDEPCMPWMHHLLSVQNELWAILNNRYDHWVVFACKPHLAKQGLHWERLPFVIPPLAQLTFTSGLDITI